MTLREFSESCLNRQRRGGYLLPIVPRSEKVKIWARRFAEGIRNAGYIEELHEGISPSSKTGDYSDVYVVSPYGKIAWNELSRFSDKELHILMVQIEKMVEFQLRTYEANKNNRHVNSMFKKSMFGEYGVSWNIPDDKFKEIGNV